MWNLSSLTRDQTHIPCIGRQILNYWTIKKVLFSRISLYWISTSIRVIPCLKHLCLLAVCLITYLSSCGFKAPECVGSVPEALGLFAPHVESQFPDQGSNPHPLHWKADSWPPGHPGSPSPSSFSSSLLISEGRSLLKSFKIHWGLFYSPEYGLSW